MPEPNSPNVVFFHVDNFGFGELGCYGLRGANTRRVDVFAAQRYPTVELRPRVSVHAPTRSACPTGCYAIRSRDIFSDAGHRYQSVG